jgi:DNA primase
LNESRNLVLDMSLLSERFTTRISMFEIAEKYGLIIDRSGFMRCPFHADETPSLKMYKEKGKGFYCFSCAKGGSIITFTMDYFKISYIDALKKLDSDFNLHIMDNPEDEATSRRYNGFHGISKISKNRKAMTLDAMIKLHCKYCQAIKFEEPFSDLFCEALYNIADLEYRIDFLENQEDI